MSFSKLQAATVRRAILDLLAMDRPRRTINDRMLAAEISRRGYTVSRDQVRGHMAWLREQDLVTVEEIGPELHVATLTQRGADVAEGNAAAPGVDDLPAFA